MDPMKRWNRRWWVVTVATYAVLAAYMAGPSIRLSPGYKAALRGVLVAQGTVKEPPWWWPFRWYPQGPAWPTIKGPRTRGGARA